MLLLSDKGDGGVRGLLVLPIHLRVSLGLWANGMGISPGGDAGGVFEPFTMRNWTLFL